mgnify:CR=1 FL=1
MATERRHTPTSQFILSVTSSLTVAVLLWIGNTASATLTQMTRLSGLVASQQRDIDRHEKEISEIKTELHQAGAKGN